MLGEKVLKKVLVVLRMRKYLRTEEALDVGVCGEPVDWRRWRGEAERLQYAGAGTGPDRQAGAGQIHRAVLTHDSKTKAQCTEKSGREEIIY